MSDEQLKPRHWLIAMVFAVLWFAFLFSPAIVGYFGR